LSGVARTASVSTGGYDTANDGADKSRWDTAQNAVNQRPKPGALRPRRYPGAWLGEPRRAEDEPEHGAANRGGDQPEDGPEGHASQRMPLPENEGDTQGQADPSADTDPKAETAERRPDCCADARSQREADADTQRKAVWSPVARPLVTRVFSHQAPSSRRRTTVFTCRAGGNKRDVSENRNAGPVNCIRLILIMAPLGWAGSLSQGIAGSAPRRRPNVGFSGRCVPSNHDAGFGAHAHRKETRMRFYQQQHQFYCGVDLHARCMYLCVLDQSGQTVLHQNYPADPRAFLDAVAPFRDGLVVAVE
jgi:hypothetical protein